MFGRFDPLGDDGLVQRVGQVDDRLGDGARVVVVGHVGDEGLVDFQDIHRQALQVGHRGITGAEVVDRDLCAHLPQLTEHRNRVGAFVHEQAFGDLDFQRRSRRAGLPQRLLDDVNQVAAAELASGVIDGDPGWIQARRSPGRMLRAGLEQHPATPGSTRPRVGWFHRNKASAPLIRPVRRSSCGW